MSSRRVMNWGDDTCLPTDSVACNNFKFGYCRFGSRCRFSHEWSEFPWLMRALMNLHKGVLWVHLGKSAGFSEEIRKSMEMKIGVIKRVDLVRMPGNPKKGGQFWCAVVYFKSVSDKAHGVLASGNCIRFGREIRVQLFRSDTKSKDTIVAKNAAQTASIQCAKAIKVTYDVVDAMNKLMIEVV